MGTLLAKTRRINGLLQKSAGHPVDFQDMAVVLSKVIECNVYVANRTGKILGYSLVDDFECSILIDQVLTQGAFPTGYYTGLLKITETSPNLCQENRQCVFDQNLSCLLANKITTVVPIRGAGDRLGTLILARFNRPFEDDDLVLAEIAATVVGMEILRARSGEMEAEARKRAAVQVAIGSLSYSELEAIRQVFEELEGEEGLLVASKIADRVGITRSVIVNALRKFESAGVIESRSLGMKGTHIRVLNDHLLQELQRDPTGHPSV